MIPQSSVKKYYRIDRREVHYLRFILEGYDGVAVMTTLDQQKGLVVLHIGPGCEKDVDMIISDLQGDIMIEPMESGQVNAVCKSGQMTNDK